MPCPTRGSRSDLFSRCKFIFICDDDIHAIVIIEYIYTPATVLFDNTPSIEILWFEMLETTVDTSLVRS